MGRRARSRGVAPSGHERRQRARDAGLGLDVPDAVSSQGLDAANEVAERLYGMGIGVLVQEHERHRKILAAQPQGRPLSRVRRARKDAEYQEARWAECLRAVTESLAAELPEGAFKYARGRALETAEGESWWRAVLRRT